MSWYSPVKSLSESELQGGLRTLVVDGVCSRVMILLVSGAFLPGMALALGASNFVIGLLASIGPVTQMLQIPSILLVERVRLRKLLTVVIAVASRLALLGVALVPFLDLGPLAVPAFLSLVMLFFAGASVSGCSFNSWMKDLVPDNIYGSFFAKRMSTATAIGAVVTIISGFGIDSLTNWLGSPAAAYGTIFGLAGVIGLIGGWTLARVPEPEMEPVDGGPGWIARLFEPMRDLNFRRLLAFTSVWNFSIIMAGAFFAVYMLRRIGIPMTWVILLAVLSQITNIYFFKLWGLIADRFSNKSVLNVSAPLFIVVILLYPFTTMPDRYWLTVPILILIHILGGISTAGFNLCTANIAMRLAPRGKATSYLAANAFCGGIAATVAPILGGVIGSFFAAREISIRLFYKPDIAGDDMVSIPAMILQGLDFVFLVAALVGVYALHRLSLVEEPGTVSDKEVRDQVFSSVRQTFASASNIAGVRRITYFPYELLRATSEKTTSAIKKAGSAARDVGWRSD